MTGDASSNTGPVPASARTRRTEDELLSVFDQLSQRVCAAMKAARETRSSWLEGVRAALSELLGLLDDDQALARLWIVGSPAGDPALRVRRAKVLSCIARALEQGAPSQPGATSPAPFGGDAVVGTVASILHARLLEDPAPRLRDLSGPLMGVIVLPYLGVEASHAEIQRALPARSTRESP